eukprot:IDg1820t1
MMKLALVGALAALLTLSHACMFPTDFETAYYRSLLAGTPFTKARVVKSVLRGRTRIYTLKVSFVYGGCVRQTPYVVRQRLRVLHAESCSKLEKHTCCSCANLAGRKSISAVSISSIADFRNLSALFLDSRNLCCKKKCRCANPNLPTVNCFRGPCDPNFEKPPCPEAKICRENFCGACRAEWFTKDKLPACKPNPFNGTTDECCPSSWRLFRNFRRHYLVCSKGSCENVLSLSLSTSTGLLDRGAWKSLPLT